MKSVSIILPTYNESGNITKLINSIYTQPGLKSYKLEFIVIDDDSPDGTAQQVQKLVKQNLPVKLLVRKNQRGLATAIAYGIKKSKSDVIVLMDTDFNHQPKDVPKLLQPILEQKADLVIGSRYIPGGGMHRSEAGAIQFLGSKYGSLLVSQILLNLPVSEALSGFIALKKSCLTRLNFKKIFQGYGEYCIRLLYYLHHRGHRLAEIPVVYGKRQYGQSKSRLMKMFINYLLTTIKLKLGNL